MVWLALTLQLALGFSGSPTDADKSAAELLSAADADPRLLEHVFPQVEDKVYELSGDTDFFHHFDEETRKAQDLPLRGAYPSTLGWAYAKLRMEDHFENESYGRHNSFGTGLYLHSDPITTKHYGEHSLKLRLPKGTRLLWASTTNVRIPGCYYLGMALSRGGPCRLKAQALLRALGVQGIIFNYRNSNAGCDQGYAVFLTSEEALNPSATRAYTSSMPTRPGYFDDYKALKFMDTGRLLGCGTSLVKVQAKLDFDRHPKLTCNHGDTPDPMRELGRQLRRVQKAMKKRRR